MTTFASLAALVPAPAGRPLATLDGYQLVARLGRGGMAEIMLASRPGIYGPELVVIKRLHEEDAEDPVILRMFLDESRLSLLLRHPNIVRSDALGLIEDRHALAMEYLEGQPLQVVLKRCATLGRQLPLEVIIPAFADMLDGLHHAHELRGEAGRELGVIHRDVSPHNLFATTFGTLKLLDFGIAKTRIQENRTRTGLLKGKVAYMAPEQAHGARVDRRADVWSAGVTLWEAITGTRLFKADNEAASLRLTLSGTITRPSEHRADVPGELDAIVMRALRRDPIARFPTALAMAEALRAWGERQHVAVAAPMRELMTELFGAELGEQRLRIQALMNASEAVPSSSSMPVLTTSVPASSRRRVIVANPGGEAVEVVPTMSEAAAMTHVSTVTEFVDRLHRDQRVAFRWISLVLGLMAVAVVALGVAFAVRVRETPSVTLAPAAYDVQQVPPGRHPVASPVAVPAAVPVEPAPAAPVVAPIASAGDGALELEPPPRATLPKHRHERPELVSATSVAAAPAPRPFEPPLRPAAPAPAPAPAPTQAPQEDGFLTLDTTPWSQVSVDGAPLGQTPIVRARLSAGPHVLTLVNSERGVSTTYQVTIEAGKTSVRRLGLD
ncbi:MAG TPA: serine/threonine-protein kinase [Polyangiaceae bacterium]|nr:serine/threonine-protein kinase [Polyangiaceae bacterium]